MPPLQVDVPTSAPPLTSTQFPLDDLLEVTEVDGDILSSFPIPGEHIKRTSVDQLVISVLCDLIIFNMSCLRYSASASGHNV